MQNSKLAMTVVLAASTGYSVGGVVSYTQNESQIGNVSNYANFNAMVQNQSLDGYQEDGLIVSSDRNYFSWDAPGLDGSEMFYAGTGSLQMVDISLASGGQFEDLDMQVSSGWLAGGQGTVFLWIQIFNEGQLLQEFDVNSVGGQYVGLNGGGFDQVLIGSYVSAEIRDLHDASQRNAMVIDNLRAGIIPAPGTLAIPAIMVLSMRRRR